MAARTLKLSESSTDSRVTSRMSKTISSNRTIRVTSDRILGSVNTLVPRRVPLSNNRGRPVTLRSLVISVHPIPGGNIPNAEAILLLTIANRLPAEATA